jgi:predicted DNA-binding transcriptional regulator YafY
MTEPEASALLLAGLPGPATELGLGAAAASARLKLLASLPSGWREQADRVGQCLHIDPLDWYRAADTPKFLREVADAVWSAHRLDVRYESWQGEVRRELEPLGLVLKAGAWYLVARSVGREGTRTYRLASVLDLKASPRTFRRPRAFNLALAWQESAARFESELRRIEARVRVSPRAMNWLENARARVAIAAPDPRATAVPRGWRDVHMLIESIEQGARQLLAFGGEVEVIEPLSLRDELLRQAERVVGLYRRRGRQPSKSGAAPKAHAAQG